MIAALDSTGLDNSRPSTSYSKKCKIKQREWTKAGLVCDTRTYFILSHTFSKGPGDECGLYLKLVRGIPPQIRERIVALLSDAGFDSEDNHYQARECYGLRKTVIKLNRRGWGMRRPLGKYRAEMHDEFPKRLFRQRSHIEAVNAQLKKVTGSVLSARKQRTRSAELFYRVQALNAMHLGRA